jgi:hypothetical protein
MPWYAAVERQGPNIYVSRVIETPFATEEEARIAAHDSVRDNTGVELETTITTFIADDFQAAKHEAIRRGIDYRLRSGNAYLMDATLRRKKYDKPYHDHCTLCWRRFLNRDDSENKPEWFEDANDKVEDSGYATIANERWRDDAHWICQECFNDLAPTFQWHVVGESNEVESPT